MLIFSTTVVIYLIFLLGLINSTHAVTLLSAAIYLVLMNRFLLYWYFNNQCYSFYLIYDLLRNLSNLILVEPFKLFLYWYLISYLHANFELTFKWRAFSGIAFSFSNYSVLFFHTSLSILIPHQWEEEYMHTSTHVISVIIWSLKTH